MAGVDDNAGRDAENAEAVKLKQFLETFALDEYGKHGIQLNEDEDEGQKRGVAEATAHDNQMYEHAVHKHQNKTRIRLVTEPQARVNEPPQNEVQADAGG